LLARRIDGIAKKELTEITATLPLELSNQSTSIVAETINARKPRNFPVDSRAKIFDGPTIGI
jgi:hypothetical protein